ncbi:MAG: amino acid ABC transporter permease [Gaiellaceae bacterium]
MTTQVDLLEPLPLPEGPPERRLPPRQWIRENLFGSVLDSVLTVAFGLFLAWAAYRIGKFVFVDAEWEVVERNLTTLMVGTFPRDELWRLWAALFVLAASLGFGAGALGAQRRREVAEGRAQPAPRGVAARRLAPVVLLVGVLLWFSGSLRNLVLVLAVTAVGAVFNVVGRRTPRRLERSVPLIVLAGVLVAFLIVVAFGGVKWSDWGGFLLTIFLAVGGILLSFPIGILLALGRRSSLPAVRIVCTAYIELIRGVPLVALIFMGVFMIGFFLPQGVERPDLVVRVLIAFVMFTSAYVAEIVRGGLQSVPAAQVEAAQALGLSPYRTTRQIVLPQALRTVIPALVGQFISLFKDTSLVFVVGMGELLTIAENITKQPDFIAQGRIVETLVFASFVYWTGSYWMSRESQRLERRLGLGER